MNTQLFRAHAKPHYSSRNNWLRAAVLGANDGLISTASLLMGLTTAHAAPHTIWLTGLAALVGGAVSMAAGEYVSVSSQSDTERADLTKESIELANNPDCELAELTAIYRSRGLDDDLARQVAIALTNHDALQAHARDEIGLSAELAANPFQAACASAAAFCVGALPPVLVAGLLRDVLWHLAATALLGLAILGAASAKLGGAPVLPAMQRVVIWGVVALASTAIIGRMFGV